MVLPTYLGRGLRLRTLLKNNFSAKYDNSYFFCSRYFWFLVFARQPAIYTVENRYKPTRRRFVPEKMTKCHKLIQLGSKPVGRIFSCGSTIQRWYSVNVHWRYVDHAYVCSATIWARTSATAVDSTNNVSSVTIIKH